MTTTERLMQLAEAWVEAEVRVSHGCHSQQRRDAKEAFRAYVDSLSSTLEAPADVRGVAERIMKTHGLNFALACNLCKEPELSEARKALSDAIASALHAHGTAQRAAERERCAKVAEDAYLLWDVEWLLTATKKDCSQRAAREIAAAIRSEP